LPLKQSLVSGHNELKGIASVAALLRSAALRSNAMFLRNDIS
jgi:hypothetical protein